MLSFKHFIKNYGKKYVALKLSEESQKRMRSWCEKNGFNISRSHSNNPISPEDFDFHITVIYSDNMKYVRNGSFNIEPIELKFLNIELLGKEKNIPTILVDKTPDISNIRKVYDATGLKDSWPAFKPHLTVSYCYKGNPDLNNVKLPDFKVMVDKIVVENQKGS